MGELGKCSICRNDAIVLYPLLAGEPAFCSEHHNPRCAEPFGCDFTGPDDFDIPNWAGQPHFDEPTSTRRKFVWTDKEGNEHRLIDIDNYYLNNIINFLKRQDDEVFEATVKFLEREVRHRRREESNATPVL